MTSSNVNRLRAFLAIISFDLDKFSVSLQNWADRLLICCEQFYDPVIRDFERKFPIFPADQTQKSHQSSRIGEIPCYQEHS